MWRVMAFDELERSCGAHFASLSFLSQWNGVLDNPDCGYTRAGTPPVFTSVVWKSKRLAKRSFYESL